MDTFSNKYILKWKKIPRLCDPFNLFWLSENGFIDVRGHFTIGIMGGTQKIACHSDVKQGSATVRIRIKTFRSEYFCRSETQLWSNKVRILY